ncbi:membrane protein [Fructobacillus fructosus]|uniref:Uncharacterized protein n=1 Tax=Fructobacillus fructosus TaxID=1631 RepID=A0ABM9MMV2_9LACO|nr:membrane protein [Fructobacillus fructosus]MBD9364477.1 hypothetical protein [Leuconostoc mesenteroides]KRN53258.1 5-methylthioadenosine S-adenosylhomocysteine nucleosidase [Fructobacillus fructosus KCTC 3544]MBC9118256.1 hypothetical protein [Fructobacillus fructosus]MCK8638107.1 hypothetical protein [Fructobacillus fructosus]CAK1224340.1 hypothetical protein R53140_OCIKHKEL_00129 [Fructobacillus fructosus]
MVNSFFSRSKESREQKNRARQRRQVEREYAKAHEDEITVVEPANRAEMRLTHKGKFELGSDGQLTQKGKMDRLSWRYNRGMIFVGVVTVLMYVLFFVLP